MLDGVFNHCGRGFWQFHHVLENGDASPFADWFHFDPDRLQRRREFLPYPDKQTADALQRGVGSFEAIGYAAWWNLPALPKFNVRNPQVREFLLSVAEHWIRFGIDGWRLDVPMEIDDDEFWRDFRRRVRAINPAAWIVGEVWGDGRRWLQGDMWDGVMNYQVTAACLGYFGGQRLDFDEARRPSGFGHIRPLSATEFAHELERLELALPARILQSQMNLLDSHDTPRFLTCVRNDTAALKMAWLLMCTLPGAPCVYYGDEIGMTGRHDPDCRRTFPQDRRVWDDSVREWYRDCIRLRHSHPALRRGTRRTLFADADVCISLHQLGQDRLIVAFNSADVTRSADVAVADNDAGSGVTASPSTEPATSVWRVWPDNRVVTRDSERHTLSVAIPARSALVLTAT